MGGKAKKEMNFSCIDEVFESIKKLSKMCCFGKNGKDEEEVEICFFDSFFVVKQKKVIGLLLYNCISSFTINDCFANIIFNKNIIMINVKGLDSETILFLNYLSEKYQTIKYNSNEKESLWSIVNNRLSNLAIGTINQINFDSLSAYYNLKKVKYDIFIKWFLITFITSMFFFIITFSFMFVYNLIKFNLPWFLFITAIIVVNIIIFFKGHIEAIIKKTLEHNIDLNIFLKGKNLIVKSPSVIVMLDNHDIKYIKYQNNYFFIKHKLMGIPIIINCENKTSDIYKLLNSIKTSQSKKEKNT